MKHSTTLQLMLEDYSFADPPLSVAMYSFIQLSELWQRGVNITANVSKRQQEGSNWGSLDLQSDLLTTTPLHHCAPCFNDNVILI